MYKQLILVCFFVCFLTPAFATITVIDDIDRNVILQKPAKRIISLAPHITESLFAAGAGENIIATVSYSDYPEAAKKIPRVGGYPTFDIERILALKPDLIIAWASGNNAQQLDKLRSLGLTIFMSEPRSPQDVANTIKRFGLLAGTSEVADKAYDNFMQHYQSLKKHFSNKEKIKVFYQFWNKPLMTVNGKHLISDVIRICGGVNVFSDLRSLSASVSLEAVLATDVEVIILGSQKNNKTLWLEEWRSWKKLAAVKNQQIYYIDPDLLNRAGPRVLLGADKLCATLDKARKN